MAFDDFLGTRSISGSTTEHETDGHDLTISGNSNSVVVACAEQCSYPTMTYYRQGPERLQGRCRKDGHTITITRRPGGIDGAVTGDSSDTGSWTADDPGPPIGGGDQQPARER